MAGNSKNVLPPFQCIKAGDMSGNITGSVTDIRYLDNVAIQMIWTGTPTGTFAVDSSLDYVPPPLPGGTPLNPGTWSPLTISPAPAASGSASSWILDMNQLSFQSVRLRYIFTSGTGTLNAYICGKSV